MVGVDLIRRLLAEAVGRLRVRSGDDRERIARTLRETRARYERLVEDATDIIYTHDLDGKMMSLNRAAERLTGVTRAEARGESITDFVVPEHVDRLRRIIDTTIAEGRAAPIEVDVETGDGRRLSLAISTHLVREDGRPVAIQGVARDVTGRRRAERERVRRLETESRARERAEAGQRRWRFLAEAGSMLASSLDYETTLKTIARLAVPTLADYVTVDMRTDGGDVRRVETAHVDPGKERIAWEIAREYPIHAARDSAVARALRDREAILLTDVPASHLHAIAGDARHLDLLRRLEMRSGIVAPLVAHGRALGCITFVITESDRHYGAEDLAFADALANRAALAADNARLYREAEEANHAKSDFLAVISHELRTPLTSIITCTELLESEIPGAVSEEQRQQLRHILRSANELLRLIEEILLFSRVEAGGEEVREVVLHIAPFVHQITALIEPMAVERGLDFAVELPATEATLRTDAAKLRKILLNLLSNAVKFTEDGAVRLCVCLEDDDTVTFTVEDTGVGIDAAEHERIFEPFWQVDGPDTRSVGGAGLGLSVTRRFARMLGGDIRVESRPGAGSTFTVRLPRSGYAARD